jgi:hypothetical protein
MKPFWRLRMAGIACTALALCAGGADATTRNNGRIHGGPIKPTSAAAQNPTHTPRRATSSLLAPWRVGKNKLPNLSSQSNAIAVEHIKVENEGFLLHQRRGKK